MQLSPTPLLSSIVKHYLIIDGGEAVNLNYRLFSDGNPGIVFHFKDPLYRHDKNNLLHLQPRCFVYGQITNYNSITSHGKLGMLVVVLQPYALFTLLHIAACELNNNIISLADIFGGEAEYLEEQILNVPHITNAISIIEKFLIARLTTIKNSDAVMQMALSTIYKNKGMLTVESLLKSIPVTERQLERKFSEHIGTSPKRFADIIKFQHFLKQLQKHPSGKTITELSYACGYYDQAHLNNYFKKNTGVTPLQYKANNHLLAINFMPVN
ncbi:helix-turn-helix domain-containing protein [Mucilaginibacter sp.]|uniref:helix-turn-helix domain-containing protein n=1 Tax=Mucilaginibacter sp. TaxID=1882438 RepID=UPI0025E22508|nr:helix-turn-helix domain-containing protein [Mucilaginibacter sp.]